MNPAQFFQIFETEINSCTGTQTSLLKQYYKFSIKDIFYAWRKAYLLQRLDYVYKNIVQSEKPASVWDVGCGYGTTGLFLSLNGICSTGTTLESYYKLIPQRKQFWRPYGNPDLFDVKVENLYETNYPAEFFDYILVQDTLHHLEPVDDALKIFRKALKNDGKIVVIDDNGNNLLQRLKLYLCRGNKRIIDFYDDNLKKKIRFGNENIRPFDEWNRLFFYAGFNITGAESIRFLPPVIMNENNYMDLLELEQRISRKSEFLKEYFYWGLNFTAEKL